jgi:hypothetical protein
MCPLTHCRYFGLYYFNYIGVVDMEPEEYKGFLIVEAPGWMFEATKIVPSPHFKLPLTACTVKSLKISINNKLNILNKTKLINRNKSVNNQG